MTPPPHCSEWLAPLGFATDESSLPMPEASSYGISPLTVFFLAKAVAEEEAPEWYMTLRPRV